MKIGELAKLASCPVVTIRFYEKEGLLAKPKRSEGNYRLYADADLERLRFVMHCRRHGMKLAEIRKLLAFRDKPTQDCAWVHQLVDEHIANVEMQIAELERLKAELVSLAQGTAKGAGCEPGCNILASLSAADACPYCQDLRCLKGNPRKSGCSSADLPDKPLTHKPLPDKPPLDKPLKAASDTPLAKKRLFK